MQNVCQKAINKLNNQDDDCSLDLWCLEYHLEDYYYEFFEGDFEKCIHDNDFPTELFEDDDEDPHYGASTGKVMLGKKVLPPR